MEQLDDVTESREVLAVGTPLLSLTSSARWQGNRTRTRPGGPWLLQSITRLPCWLARPTPHTVQQSQLYSSSATSGTAWIPLTGGPFRDAGGIGTESGHCWFGGELAMGPIHGSSQGGETLHTASLLCCPLANARRGVARRPMGSIPLGTVDSGTRTRDKGTSYVESLAYGIGDLPMRFALCHEAFQCSFLNSSKLAIGLMAFAPWATLELGLSLLQLLASFQFLLILPEFESNGHISSESRRGEALVETCVFHSGMRDPQVAIGGDFDVTIIH